PRARVARPAGGEAEYRRAPMREGAPTSRGAAPRRAPRLRLRARGLRPPRPPRGRRRGRRRRPAGARGLRSGRALGRRTRRTARGRAYAWGPGRKNGSARRTYSTPESRVTMAARTQSSQARVTSRKPAGGTGTSKRRARTKPTPAPASITAPTATHCTAIFALPHGPAWKFLPEASIEERRAVTSSSRARITAEVHGGRKAGTS